MNPAPALTLKDLSCTFQVNGGLFQPARHVRAVDQISFTLEEGGVLGIVGESGCGKTTLARMILGLQSPTSGEAFVHGQRLSELDRRARARLIQPVFQDPFSSLNPKHRIEDIIALPLRAQGSFEPHEIERRTAAILERVGLSTEQGRRLPAELSGGQRQRVAIARALILEPRIVVCDEPTSALDVSVQAQILNLLGELRRDLKLTYVFISHDLNVVRYISDRVMVMYLGQVVEIGDCETLFTSPRHPYTRALLSSVPSMDPDHRTETPPLAGDPPNPINPPSGCRFHTRCAQAEAVCSKKMPPLESSKDGQGVACWIHVENSGHSQAVLNKQVSSNQLGAA